MFRKLKEKIKKLYSENPYKFAISLATFSSLYSLIVIWSLKGIGAYTYSSNIFMIIVLGITIYEELRR